MRGTYRGLSRDRRKQTFSLLSVLSLCTDLVVRGGIEPPTFRFSGVADVLVSVVAAAWTAADVCPCMGTVAVVAVTVAVSSGPPPARP
jgi:hypothetical protein